MARRPEPARFAPRPSVQPLADARLRADPGYSAFELGDSPLYLLVRTAGLYGVQMGRALRSAGTDLPSWRALMIVHEKSPSSVSEIAERAVTPLSTMTRVVQRLEKRGLVKLARRESDSRVTEVFTTAAGERAAMKVRHAASRVYAAAFAGVSSAQITSLNRTLRELYARLAGIP
jgi:MarR family transcriptional regulator, organic hydroperoxide resistance regulator